MEEELRVDEETIDLVEIFHLLCSKMLIIVLCMAIGASASGLYTKLFVSPMYQAASTLYILGDEPDAVSMTNIQIGHLLAKDFQELVRKRSVVEDAIEKAGMDVPYEKILPCITIENPEDTRLLELKISYPDPYIAKRLADGLAAATSDKIVAVMNTERPSLVEPAVVPVKPSTPNVTRNIMMGAVLGGILAIAVIIVRFMMDDTVKNEEDIKKYLNLNTLAVFPQTKRKKRR